MVVQPGCLDDGFEVPFVEKRNISNDFGKNFQRTAGAALELF
jgi:hypothetical protein